MMRKARETAENNSALDDAEAVLDGFILMHRSAAIPAMISACVGWAIRNGAGDLIRASLSAAIEMSVKAERAHRKGMQ